METAQRIFELSEVAEILHLPASRVKNWTIGRPLTITPSVRQAKGTGSRNLYGADDMYLFALAEELNAFGLVPRFTQQVLDRVRGKVTPEKALLIAGSAEKPDIELFRLQDCTGLLGCHMGKLDDPSTCTLCGKKIVDPDLSYEVLARLAKWKKGAYLLDLSDLVMRVSKLIHKRLRRG